MTQSFRRMLLLAAAALSLGSSAPAFAQTAGGDLAWAMRYDPKTLDPAKVNDQASELVRYLTGGVLLRVNRKTEQPEGDLADRWNISSDGRTLSFHLRKGLVFSDGSALSATDVVWSLRRVLSPEVASPIAEEFLSPKDVRVESPDQETVQVVLPTRIIGIAAVFDEIAIEPANRPSQARVTAGPFVVADFKQGEAIHLRRNPHYWKHDGSGASLPYASGIRLDILNNREQEIARFGRGDYDLIDQLPPEYYRLLSERKPAATHDLGPSLNTEQLWFNQTPGAPLPPFEKAWFRNSAFRVAVSEAIHRADLARIAFDGHATVAHGFISPANIAWYNAALHSPVESPAEAARLLNASGFHKSGGLLFDAAGNPVKFSILTNAGNAARAKMATLLQQDLAALGMQVTVVTLDFPALIERLMHTSNYEACLLGHSNVSPDPNSMMNEWLSSSVNHQWNPSEKTPATPWEAEIDKQMRLQATSLDPRIRKRAVDRVQQIVADEQPFIYLVHPNTLSAVSPTLLGVDPTVFQPGLVWNVAYLHHGPAKR